MSPVAAPRASVPDTWTKFVEAFGEGWADPELDKFIAHFRPLFEENAVLIQPMNPTVVGHDGLERVFKSFFTIIPDIRGEIVRWGAGEDAVFIEMELTAKIGRRTVKVRACDHLLLTPEGTVIERWAFLNPLPFIGALLRSPSCWPRLVRAGR
jgi:hypothetical protein